MAAPINIADVQKYERCFETGVFKALSKVAPDFVGKRRDGPSTVGRGEDQRTCFVRVTHLMKCVLFMGGLIVFFQKSYG